MKQRIIGIRELAEFVGRSGSITNQFTLASRALEGTQLHQKYQSMQQGDYHKEVVILTTLNLYDYEITLQGRIDGMYIDTNSVHLEELKSTYVPLEEIEDPVSSAHYNQLMIYGYLYCLNYDLLEIDLHLVYIHVTSNEIKKLNYHYTINELKEIFMKIFDVYYKFLKYEEENTQLTLASIDQLEFPYENKREGQSKMMNAVYYTIKQKNKLFIQASTGLGKTLGVLYPSLKALKANYTNKLLYLTAKTITRNVAIETIELLEAKGLMINTVIINSKDSMCLLEKRDCNPINCPYADHYYNKVNEALYDALCHEHYFNDQIITEYALRYKICPFEFSLDLFDFCKLAILDYNYVFDPRVALVRIFNPGNENTLLIDEAHNLVERSRDMFSAVLYYDAALKAQMIIDHKSNKLSKRIEAIIEEFRLLREKLSKEEYLILSLPPVKLIEEITYFFNEALEYLQEKGSEHEDFLEFFFECSRFKAIFELYDSNYTTYVMDGPLSIKLFCIDPTELLIEKYDQCTSSIFFSATLLPITYFYSILGGKENDKKLYFPSSFDIKKRKILIAKDVDTRYSVRNKSVNLIAQYIYRFTRMKKGNYLVLFSSYEYMNRIYEIVEETYDLKIYKQESNMSMDSRNEFLSLFKSNETTQVFFGILGGLFSEGIDFKGEQLIGCIIVGVGLPQLSLERDLIKEYYQDNGFDYSYRYPGFNKVLQGAGRVIRTEEDYGAILLLDDRYLQYSYTKMFPYEWSNCLVTDIDHVSSDVEAFWNSLKK